MNEDLYLSTAINLYESKVWDDKVFKENVLKHAKEKNLDINAINELINRVLPKKDFTISEKRQFLTNLTFNEGGLKYPNAVEHMADTTVEKLFEIEKASKSYDEILNIIKVKNNKVDKKVYAEELSLYELLTKLRSLNPNTDLNLDNINGTILSSKNMEELRLPEGFYYNKNNEITNENNTKSGNYISAKITLVHKVEKNEILDKIVNKKEAVHNKETKEVKEDNKKEINLILFANELLKLNPDANINLDRENNTIVSSIGLNDLKLPEGYYHNETGIVDKDNYIYIPVQIIPLVKKEVSKEEKKQEAENKTNSNKDNIIILPNIGDTNMFFEIKDNIEEKSSVIIPDKTKMDGQKDEPTTEEEYKEIHKAVLDAEKDSNVREVKADSERINKLKSKKGKVINYFIKGAIVVTAVALLSPINAAILIGGYKVFANKIKNGTFNPTGHFGQAVASVVKKVMYVGLSEEQIEEERGKTK